MAYDAIAVSRCSSLNASDAFTDTVNQFPCSDDVAVAFWYALSVWYAVFLVGILVRFMCVASPLASRRRALQSAGAAAETTARSDTGVEFTSAPVAGAASAATSSSVPKPTDAVEIRYYFALLGYLLVMALIIAVAIPLLRTSLRITHESLARQYNVTANDVARGAPGVPTLVSSRLYTTLDALLAIMYGGMVHLFLAPAVMLLKLYGILRPVPISDLACASPAADDGRTWVIRSARLSFWQSMLMMTFGLIDSIVQQVISFLASFGLDLSILWFPSPFFNLLRNALVVDSMRIDGHRVVLRASWHDAYLYFVYDKCVNFLTLTLWERCFAARSYNVWLDSNLAFRGTMAPGCRSDGAFVFFSVRVSYWWKLMINVLSLLLPPVSLCWAHLELQVATTDLMQFGGRRIQVIRKPWLCEWIVMLIVRSFFGLLTTWKRDLDTRIGWAKSTEVVRDSALAAAKGASVSPAAAIPAREAA